MFTTRTILRTVSATIASALLIAATNKVGSSAEPAKPECRPDSTSYVDMEEDNTDWNKYLIPTGRDVAPFGFYVSEYEPSGAFKTWRQLEQENTERRYNEFLEYHKRIIEQMR
ncbi:hypothetical protein BLD44_023230 [Mastigocladus laminosus UU774]|nr:hypothetical protein BLD44_023230 [Mastigocladus laminosus UU774]